MTPSTRPLPVQLQLCESAAQALPLRLAAANARACAHACTPPCIADPSLCAWLVQCLILHEILEGADYIFQVGRVGRTPDVLFRAVEEDTRCVLDTFAMPVCTGCQAHQPQIQRAKVSRTESLACHAVTDARPVAKHPNLLQLCMISATLRAGCRAAFSENVLNERPC